MLRLFVVELVDCVVVVLEMVGEEGMEIGGEGDLGWGDMVEYCEDVGVEVRGDIERLGGVYVVGGEE